MDFRQVGHITDDEMHRILVRPLSAGVRLTAIFDSCHSGTALDLPYIYSTHGILKEPNLAREAGQGLLSVLSSYSQGDIGGMIKKGMGLFTKATRGEDAHNRALATKTSAADVIMLSGSKDDQTSYVDFFFCPGCPKSSNLFRYSEKKLGRRGDALWGIVEAPCIFLVYSVLQGISAGKRKEERKKKKRGRRGRRKGKPGDPLV